MNFVQRFFMKHIIADTFREMYVETGYVQEDFKVVWDKKKKEFDILWKYTEKAKGLDSSETITDIYEEH